jgi:hypothetical protein
MSKTEHSSVPSYVATTAKSAMENNVLSLPPNTCEKKIARARPGSRHKKKSREKQPIGH